MQCRNRYRPITLFFDNTNLPIEISTIIVNFALHCFGIFEYCETMFRSHFFITTRSYFQARMSAEPVSSKQRSLPAPFQTHPWPDIYAHFIFIYCSPFLLITCLMNSSLTALFDCLGHRFLVLMIVFIPSYLPS